LPIYLVEEPIVGYAFRKMLGFYINRK